MTEAQAVVKALSDFKVGDRVCVHRVEYPDVPSSRPVGTIVRWIGPLEYFVVDVEGQTIGRTAEHLSHAD